MVPAGQGRTGRSSFSSIRVQAPFTSPLLTAVVSKQGPRTRSSSSQSSSAVSTAWAQSCARPEGSLGTTNTNGAEERREPGPAAVRNNLVGQKKKHVTRMMMKEFPEKQHFLGKKTK